VRDLDVGRVVRAIRRRRNWRQADVAMRAGLHRSTVSDIEGGSLDDITVRTVRRCLKELDVRLDLEPRWRGAELDRLLDENHARKQAAWKERLERWAWQVIAEASFNRYGERGRIDLLAWHPGLAILLVVEIKSELVDAQSLLGGMDVKTRVAI
jgi:transcriptional regulator with XRE-family HTH domain